MAHLVLGKNSNFSRRTRTGTLAASILLQDIPTALVGHYTNTRTHTHTHTVTHTWRANNSSVRVLQPRADGRPPADHGKSMGRRWAMVRVSRSSTERSTARTAGGNSDHFCLAARRNEQPTTTMLCLLHSAANGRTDASTDHGMVPKDCTVEFRVDHQMLSCCVYRHTACY